MEGGLQAKVITPNGCSKVPWHAQVPDHFEWRYLVAMDLALATTYIGETRYRQGIWGQIMDQVSALLCIGSQAHPCLQRTHIFLLSPCL